MEMLARIAHAINSVETDDFLLQHKVPWRVLRMLLIALKQNTGRDHLSKFWARIAHAINSVETLHGSRKASLLGAYYACY